MNKPRADRRKDNQDRRSTERQGKYDRRRNRCGHCQHFQLTEPQDESNTSGQCLLHQQSVGLDSFACPDFSPIQPTTSPAS